MGSEPEIRLRGPVEILTAAGDRAYELALWLHPETRDEQRARVAKARKKAAARAAKSGHDRPVTRRRKKSNSKSTNGGSKK